MLFGIAYRILASVADAEDVLQDTWLKWSSVDPGRLDQPRAYLARTVTNLSINRLKSARRPRYDAPADTRRRVTDRFLAACVGGDLNQMMELLAPDVTAWTDGGGKVRAARRPLHGAENVARWILGVLRRFPADLVPRPVLVNGQPGLLVTSAGVPDNVVVVDPGPDGRIDAIRLIRNPDKLAHLAAR